MSRADRALALAGVFQAAKLVHEVAWQGAADPQAIDATLSSLFRFDAPDTPAVYGGATRVATGLRALIEHLSGRSLPAEASVMRYVLGLLHLERRADAADDAWQRLHDGLVAADRQAAGRGASDEATVAALATLYAEIISPLGPRIIVEGETNNLRDETKASLIRALLLGGIRSAVLWRQLGASRWSLLLSRRRFVSDAESWLSVT